MRVPALMIVSVILMGAWGSAAHADPVTGAPVASARGVIDLGQRSAELGGHLDPKGLPTIYYFEYGRDSGYGRRTASRTVSVQPNVDVYARARDLELHTAYHYRLVATNPAGTDRGGDRVFATLGRQRASVGLVVGPRRDPVGPYRFTYSGRVRLPALVSRADACTGTVRVTVRYRGRIAGILSARLDPATCTYRVAHTVSTRHIAPHGALTARARVENRALLPTRSVTRLFRYGRP